MNHFAIPLELLATITGLAGAWYVAAEDRERAAWGFVAFLASNAAWIAFGYINGHWILIVQQLGFTALSLRGIWKKALRVRVRSFRQGYRAVREKRGVLAAARFAWRCF
jgi:hypothetical protein